MGGNDVHMIVHWLLAVVASTIHVLTHKTHTHMSQNSLGKKYCSLAKRG